MLCTTHLHKSLYWHYSSPRTTYIGSGFFISTTKIVRPIHKGVLRPNKNCLILYNTPQWAHTIFMHTWCTHGMFLIRYLHPPPMGGGGSCVRHQWWHLHRRLFSHSPPSCFLLLLNTDI